MNSKRTPLMLAGALLVLLGVAGLAVPVFETHQMTDVAKVGDVKLQADENTTHVVPQALSIAALVVGLVLAGFAVTRPTA